MLGKIRQALHLNRNLEEELPPQNKKAEGKSGSVEKSSQKPVDGKVQEGKLTTENSELKVKPITDPEVTALVLSLFEDLAKLELEKQDYEKTEAETREHQLKFEESVQRIEILRKEQDEAIKEHEAAMKSFQAAEEARLARLEANTKKLAAIKELRAKRAAGGV